MFLLYSLTKFHFIFKNKIRFVFISDTHSKIDKMTNEIPDGDILIHAGDFTSIGKIDEVKKFSDFLKSLNNKFKYKIVIAGKKIIKIYSLFFSKF